MVTTPKGRADFQWWAIDLIGATPVGGVKKMGADRGIDGKITFTEANGRLQTVLVSVKSGNVNPSMVRDLRGTVERGAGGNRRVPDAGGADGGDARGSGPGGHLPLRAMEP